MVVLKIPRHFQAARFGHGAHFLFANDSNYTKDEKGRKHSGSTCPAFFSPIQLPSKQRRQVMNKKDELESGWTIEPGLGIYHFEHVSSKKVKKLLPNDHELFVVETVNWTLTDEKKEIVHLNKYFAFGINDALAIAVRIQLAADTVAEDFLRLRVSTQEEYDAYTDVIDHFEKQMPKPLSDDEARSLSSI
jgi:hypothetical protein